MANVSERAQIIVIEFIEQLLIVTKGMIKKVHLSLDFFVLYNILRARGVLKNSRGLAKIGWRFYSFLHYLHQRPGIHGLSHRKINHRHAPPQY